MPFLTQGNTNWKFLLIVVVLAIIVGGGILFWNQIEEIPQRLTIEEKTIQEATISELKNIGKSDNLLQLEGIIGETPWGFCINNYWLEDSTGRICLTHSIKNIDSYIGKPVVIEGYYHGYDLVVDPSEFFSIKKIKIKPGDEAVDLEVHNYLSVGCGQECVDCCYVYTYKGIKNNEFIDLKRIAIHVSEEALNECAYLVGYKNEGAVTFKDIEIIKDCIRKTETDSDIFDKMIAGFFCDDFIFPEWGKLIGVTYMTQEIDLNNNGVNEIIVTGELCSYEKENHYIVSHLANYPHIVLQKEEESWIKIGSFTGRSPLVKKEKTNEYYDIEVEIKWGAEYYRIELYQWQGDKSEYELTESREGLL